MTMKIACSVSGDLNIIYPGFITLASVKRYNPELEYFLCINDEIHDQEFLRRLDENGIKYINLINDPDLNEYLDGYERTFAKFTKALFIKFYLPCYFKSLGYDYLITMDSDILCKQIFDLKEILPQTEVYSCRPITSLEREIDKKYHNNIIQKLALSKNLKQLFPNAGFLVFNIANYLQCDYMHKFREIYNFTNTMDIFCPEEKAIGLCDAKYDIKTKYLDDRYNSTAMHWNRKDNINYHYCMVKPFDLPEQLNNDKLKVTDRYNVINVIFYCYEYLLYADSLGLYDKICNQPLSISTLFNYVRKIENEYLSINHSIYNQLLDNNYSKLWKHFLLTSNLDERIEANCNILKASYLQFFCIDIPEVHYEIYIRNGDYFVSLDFEGHKAVGIFKKFFDYFKEFYPYDYSSTPLKLAISKKVTLDKMEKELNLLVVKSYEGLRKVYNSYIQANGQK